MPCDCDKAENSQPRAALDEDEERVIWSVMARQKIKDILKAFFHSSALLPPRHLRPLIEI